MERLTVCKTFTFAAAHKLPNYDGACAKLHGHEWKLEVAVSGIPRKDTGMVMDFSLLKAIVNDEVIGVLDHNFLNDLLTNPTAETMVLMIVDILKHALKDHTDIELESVRLYETTTSYCEWRK